MSERVSQEESIPRAKILTTAEMDILNQFGALVTNGQEELASLSYLITMEFSQANSENIAEIGDYFESSLRKLGEKYSDVVSKVEERVFWLPFIFMMLIPRRGVRN